MDAGCGARLFGGHVAEKCDLNGWNQAQVKDRYPEVHRLGEVDRRHLGQLGGWVVGRLVGWLVGWVAGLSRG